MDIERLLIDADRTKVLVEFVRVFVDVGVSERICGIDPWVFVLLNDDVEPPVDVDCRFKLDDDEPDKLNDARRIVGVIALGRGRDVDRVDGVGITVVERCACDWTLVVVVVVVFFDDRVAVIGRAFGKVDLPFEIDDDNVLVTDCSTREEAVRATTPVFSAEACKNTQTYTQMCNSVYLKNAHEKNLYSKTYVYMFVCLIWEKKEDHARANSKRLWRKIKWKI
jgi:hypothetical protein